VGRVPGTRVAVCENGSGGDAAPRLRRAIDENGWGTWADLVVSPVNGGFTGGNNLVLRGAMARPDPPEYFLLLNSDTLVPDGALEALVSFMDRTPRAGIAGSRLVWPEGGSQGTPFRFLSLATELQDALRLGPVSRLLRSPVSLEPKPEVATRVDWVAGASMILRRTMLEQVGLLDEGLFTYFDDVDLCLRAARGGWETWFVPDSVVVHLEGGSTGVAAHIRRRRPAYWFQARRRFWLKNHGPLQAALVDLAFILGFAAWRLRRLVQRKPDPDPPRMLADFVRHSVFVAGFRVEDVVAPEMQPGAVPSAGTG
jgi:GT2 family glycosyltransferase